jgi:protein-L-isoaspartate O-methyltransferase
MKKSGDGKLARPTAQGGRCFTVKHPGRQLSHHEAIAAGLAGTRPFDAIVVTAAPEEVPRALVAQLAGGRMVIPVRGESQEMMIVERGRGGVTKRRTIPVRFVPMTGKPSPQP